MLKKRIIFTLLYDQGHFIQSRNFRRQKIGDKSWINKNYNFNYISKFIDELVILDISKKKNKKEFMKNCKSVTSKVFVPISIGGGIKNIKDAKFYFKNGADKVLINSSVIDNPNILNSISDSYGSSSVIISADVKRFTNSFYVYFNNGLTNSGLILENYLKKISKFNFSEIYLNSIDRDGTGNGIDYFLLKTINKFNFKYIITGGLGNYNHFYKTFKYTNKVEAIATANLLNFVGDSLKIVRQNLIKRKIKLVNRN